MAVYVYRGTDRSGAAISGEQAATSKTELMNQLKRQQIKVSKLSEKGKEFNIPTFGGGVNAKDLAVFTRQFSVMIDAGLPLVQCLGDPGGPAGEQNFPNRIDVDARRGGRRGHAVRGDAPAREGFRRALRQSRGSGRDRRYSGHDFAAAFELHRKERKLKRAVKSALVYPVAVLTVAAGVIALLLWKVVPIFAHVVLGLGRGLAAAHPHCHRH